MPRRGSSAGKARWRRAVVVAFIGWTGGTIHAQEFDFPILLPKWDREISFQTGAGYRDNVGLSTQSPQASAFILTGLELILLRLPENGTQFHFFLSGQDLRFLSSSIVNKEQAVFAQALVKRDFGSGWEGSLGVEYVYQNQVVDVSITEPGLTTVPVEGHGIVLRPELRHDFAENFWVSLELSGRRQFFRLPLDDYWDYGRRLTLGKSYGSRSEVSFGYQIEERAYDLEELRTMTGESIPGTHRKSLHQEVRLIWKHYWDTQNHWRTMTKLTARRSEDNGMGYFDYTKLQAGEQILFHTKHWDISAEARVARYDYPVQTVPDLAKRQSSELAFDFRFERRLSGFLKVFAEYEREQVFSNLDLERYQVNTVKGGLNWTF